MRTYHRFFDFKNVQVIISFTEDCKKEKLLRSITSFISKKQKKLLIEPILEPPYKGVFSPIHDKIIYHKIGSLHTTWLGSFPISPSIQNLNDLDNNQQIRCLKWFQHQRQTVNLLEKTAKSKWPVEVEIMTIDKTHSRNRTGEHYLEVIIKLSKN